VLKHFQRKKRPASRGFCVAAKLLLLRHKDAKTLGDTRKR